jgi:hypothetical protein
MTTPNQNSFSPFLVIRQTEGAEKALIKITAALFPEEVHSFSPKVYVLRSLSKPFQRCTSNRLGNF